MKNLFSITFILSFFFLANAELKSTISYSIDSSVFKSELKNDESIYYISFNNLPLQTAFNNANDRPQHTIIFSYGFGNVTSVLGEKNEFEISLKPGSYTFQFYYSDSYEEISTASINILPKHKTYISCYLNLTEHLMIECLKPVIYLYPEKPTLIEVKVKPKGDFTFTYPNYSTSWKVNAEPIGELKIGDKSYNYLFWESSQKAEKHLFEFRSGFIVEKENVISFLDSKLSEMGLNSKETADFITFWGPQLIKQQRSFIHFIFNEECDQFAELNITPKPKHIYRVYMITQPLFDNEIKEIKNQVIKPFDRNGFTVIEWGGSILPKENNISKNLN